MRGAVCAKMPATCFRGVVKQGSCATAVFENSRLRSGGIITWLRRKGELHFITDFLRV